MHLSLKNSNENEIIKSEKIQLYLKLITRFFYKHQGELKITKIKNEARAIWMGLPFLSSISTDKDHGLYVWYKDLAVLKKRENGESRKCFCYIFVIFYVGSCSAPSGLAGGI